MNLVKKLKLLIPGISLEKNKTLSTLQIIIATLFLVGAALMCYVFVRNEWTSAAYHVIASGESLTELLAASAEEPIRRGSFGEVQAVVSRLNKADRVTFVRVTDADGNLVALSGRTALAADLEREKPTDSWNARGIGYRVYKLPETGAVCYLIERSITSDGAGLGRVQVALMHPSLLDFMRGGVHRGEIAIFGVALLLVLVNYFLHVLVGPIARLKHTVLEARDAQTQDQWEKLQAGLPKEGEAGQIGAAIESIIAKLGEGHRTLLDSNRELQVSNRVILFEKRRTESVIDGLDVGVIVTDSYGRTSLINHEAEVLLDVSRKEVIGRTPDEAFASHGKVVRFMSGEQSDSSRRRSADIDFSDEEGKKVVRAQFAPMRGPSDENAGALTVLRDITQQKMEEDARRSFISNVAHELRAPLSAIKSYAEMLIDNEADTPALRAEFFNTINEEADRLARLIDNMLNISKIEIGGLVLNKASVRTRKMLEDALTSVRATAKSKSIDISADLPDDMPDVDLDKELIRVVVMNLLGNAIKYTDPGGSIVVSGEVDPDEMRVHVVDTGWGIPLDEQEKVFEKFYRGERTATEKTTGNGLGLALAREIACLHGGDLRLLSEEGKGSKFTLHLPLK